MDAPVRSVSYAFAILRTLSAMDGAQSLTAIARATELSPSSCLNLLRTLVAEGAIVVENGKRYRLSPEWSAFTALAGGPLARLIAQAQPLMKRFAHEQDVAVGLWHLKNGERLELVALQESDSPTRIHMAIGQRQPIGGGSTGRALAAHRHADEDELRGYFAALRWRIPISFETYQRQVAEAAGQGYAIDDGLGFAGICSLACALDVSATTYCLSASTFSGGRDGDALRALGAGLCTLGQGIAALGQATGG